MVVVEFSVVLIVDAVLLPEGSQVLEKRYSCPMYVAPEMLFPNVYLGKAADVECWNPPLHSSCWPLSIFRSQPSCTFLKDPLWSLHHARALLSLGTVANFITAKL